MQRAARLKRELQMLSSDPPHGVTCWLVEDSTCELEAQVVGQDGTPYHRGLFKILLHLPERYPFEAPKVRFSTPIYHPNVDTGGRICLDILKPPPSGSWKPSMNISSVLTSLLLLMAEPNPDDPLMVDISTEFKQNRLQFMQTAREWTKKYAMDGEAPAAPTTTAAATVSATSGIDAGSAGTLNQGSTSKATKADLPVSQSKSDKAVVPSSAPAKKDLLTKRRQPATATDSKTNAPLLPAGSSRQQEQVKSAAFGKPGALAAKPMTSRRAITETTCVTLDDIKEGSSRKGVLVAENRSATPSPPISRAIKKASASACIVIDDDDSDSGDAVGYTNKENGPPNRGRLGVAAAVKRPAILDDDNDDNDDSDANRKRVCRYQDTDSFEVTYRSDEDIL